MPTLECNKFHPSLNSFDHKVKINELLVGGNKKHMRLLIYIRVSLAFSYHKHSLYSLFSLHVSNSGSSVSFPVFMAPFFLEMRIRVYYDQNLGERMWEVSEQLLFYRVCRSLHYTVSPIRINRTGSGNSYKSIFQKKFINFMCAASGKHIESTRTNTRNTTFCDFCNVMYIPAGWAIQQN